MGVEDPKIDDVVKPPVDDPGAKDKPPVEDPPDMAGIKKDLKGERERRQTAETELATLKAAQEAAATKEAEAAGEFERLYGTEKTRADDATTKLTALEAREDTRLEQVTADADAVVAKWPEADKALDPKALGPDDRLRMVRQLEARLSQTERPAGTRNNGNDKDAPVPDWVKENYRKHHVGLDAPDDEKLRKWEGYLRKEPLYADKFKTNTT